MEEAYPFDRPLCGFVTLRLQTPDFLGIRLPALERKVRKYLSLYAMLTQSYSLCRGRYGSAPMRCPNIIRQLRFGFRSTAWGNAHSVEGCLVVGTLYPWIGMVMFRKRGV